MTAKITITAEFDTVSEVAEFMTNAGHSLLRLGPRLSQIPAFEVKTALEPKPDPKPVETEPKPDPKPVETEPKPVEAAPKPVEAAPKQPNKPVQAVPVTKTEPDTVTTITSHPATPEGARAALRDVYNAKGAKVATEILTRFGASSISKVKPEQFADFIKACAA